MPKTKCCGRCAHASGPFELAPKSIIGGAAYICTCAESDACFDLVDAAYCCGRCEPQDEVQGEEDAIEAEKTGVSLFPWAQRPGDPL